MGKGVATGRKKQTKQENYRGKSNLASYEGKTCASHNREGRHHRKIIYHGHTRRQRAWKGERRWREVRGRSLRTERAFYISIGQGLSVA